MSLKQRKQFCKNGHDTFMVGRYSRGECKACSSLRAFRWAESHPEKIRKASRKWKKEHPQKVKDIIYKWRDENPGKVAQIKLKTQTNRNLRIPSFGQDGIELFYNNCPNDMVVDHIIPLQGKDVSGLHVLKNLQYLTQKENAIKHNSFDGTPTNNSWRKEK